MHYNRPSPFCVYASCPYPSSRGFDSVSFDVCRDLYWSLNTTGAVCARESDCVRHLALSSAVPSPACGRYLNRKLPPLFSDSTRTREPWQATRDLWTYPRGRQSVEARQTENPTSELRQALPTQTKTP